MRAFDFDFLIMSKKDEQFARSLSVLENIPREGLMRWLYDEQLKLVHSGQPTQTISAYLAASMVALLCWQYQPSIMIFVWLASMYLVQAYAVFLYFDFKRAAAKGDNKNWGVRYIACISASAFSWAILTWLVPAQSATFESAQLIGLMVVMAGGAAQQYVYSPGTISFTMIMSLIIGLKLMINGGLEYLLLGFGLLLLGIFLSAAFINISRAVARSILLNKALEMQLTQSDHDRNALRIANEKLQKANAAKSRFLAAASHDLRQPMHAIGLLVGALRGKSQQIERDSMMGMIEDSVDTLQSLFNGILDISKLDAEEIKISENPVQIDKIFEIVAQQYDALAEKKGISLEWSISGAIVSTDAMLLTRIISNLVSNAISYTESGRVLLRSRFRGAFVVVQVWDTGIGIPSDFREVIFDEFFQIGNPQRDSTRGVGLGLSIVRRTAQLLGISIAVLSKPGKGSLFTLRLPLLDRNNLPASRNSEADDLRDLNLYVLLVEDEPKIRMATAELLSQMGCQCASAGSFSEALEKFSAHLRMPDLLVCDYWLGPEGDGIDTIQAIRQRAEVDIPALLISGDLLSTPPDLANLTFLSKPLSAQALRNAIGKFSSISTLIAN